MVSKRKKRRNFSSFSLNEAIKEVSIKKLLPWSVESNPIEPSDLFKAILDRLKQFDTRSNERGRELIIDAILAEAIVSFKHLKIWKGAALKSDELNGEADYLVTDDKDYLESPFLCVVEAKKDDFEQGLAQCLVEMKVCWLNNLELGRKIEVLGIVTNGSGWKFYRWAGVGEVYETSMYGEHEMPAVFGALNHVLQRCDRAIGEA